MQVVAYRAAPLTEWAAVRLAAVRHVALPNLVLGREVLPEAVFSAATPQRLAAHLAALLRNDDQAASRQRAAGAEFLHAVSPPLPLHMHGAGRGAPPDARRPAGVAAVHILRSAAAALRRRGGR